MVLAWASQVGFWSAHLRMKPAIYFPWGRRKSFAMNSDSRWLCRQQPYGEVELDLVA